MAIAAGPISEDRALTAQESELVAWLLQHGNPGAERYLPQVDQLRVVSRCACGCASIDFSIAGKSPPRGGGLEVLSDYVWQATDGPRFGVFVFAKDEVLAGLEIWSVEGLATGDVLPKIEQLAPLAPLVNKLV